MGDKGEETLVALRRAARQRHEMVPVDASTRDQEATIQLPQRPWFQRIWVNAVLTAKYRQVLQEAAAARCIVVKCGTAEIDGSVFCTGLAALDPCHDPPAPEMHRQRSRQNEATNSIRVSDLSTL
ncbi:hypothetical protein Sste5344_005838 [Sporothrix stenoceras]